MLRRAFLAALLLVALPAAASGWDRFFMLSLGDFPQELAEAKKAGKKGVVFVYQQDPCPYCERMKANVLSRADVQKAYGERFAAFSIDVRGAQEMVDFSGRKTTEGKFAREALVRGAPVVDFYNIDGRLVARIPGEISDAGTFLALGDWIASGAHEKQSFDQYRASRGLPAAPLKINQFKP